MQDHAAIILDGTATGTSYWFYGILVNNGISPKIELLNNSRITGNPNIISLTCGIITNSSSAKDVRILLNMEADGSEEESASITDMSHGIYLGAAENSTVSYP